MSGDRHRRAAEIHERAAEKHARSARFWDAYGDPALADLERRTAEHEYEAADIERERARLKEARGMDARLRELLDAEDGSPSR